MPLSSDTAKRKDSNVGIPEMQHRHFAFIASVIRDSDSRWTMDKYRMACLFAGKLQQSNPRFDVARFMLACGKPD